MAEAKMLNLDKVLARLAKLPKRVQEAAAAQLEKEAAELAEAIKRAVPVDTGALQGSIKVKEGPRPLSKVIVAGGLPTTVKVRSGVSDRDFARALETGGNRGEFDYARAVEFGHRTHDGKHINGRPFFFPTYRARKRAMRSRMSAAARKAAQDALRRN